MRKFIVAGTLLLLAVFIYSFISPKAVDAAFATETKIKWYSWEEALAESKDNPKKLFIDVYTDWCGWCKRMDKTTFQDPKIVEYMNENFYAVKFNAEQKEDIDYNGHTLKYRPNGRRGFHELAYSLLDGRLSYPSYVYLDEVQNRITVSPGYKTADALIKELQYVAEDHYKSTSFRDYDKK